MAIHWWSTYSSLATIDQETNNVSAIDMIETIRVPPPPETEDPRVILMRGAVVTLWGRDNPDTPEHLRGRIRWMDPDEQEVVSQVYEIDLRQHERARIRLNLDSIPIRDPGKYHWEISYANMDNPNLWHDGTRLPVQVVFDSAG